MSLNWHAGKVVKSPVNWCNEGECTCNGADTLGRQEAHWKLGAIPQLCWLLMVIGVNGIKNEAAAMEVYSRFLLLRAIDSDVAEAWGDIITPAFLRSAIGYGTNISSMTKATFASQQIRRVFDRVQAQARRDFEDLTA